MQSSVIAVVVSDLCSERVFFVHCHAAFSVYQLTPPTLPQNIHCHQIVTKVRGPLCTLPPTHWAHGLPWEMWPACPPPPPPLTLSPQLPPSTRPSSLPLEGGEWGWGVPLHPDRDASTWTLRARVASGPSRVTSLRWTWRMAPRGGSGQGIGGSRVGMAQRPMTPNSGCPWCLRQMGVWHPCASWTTLPCPLFKKLRVGVHRRSLSTKAQTAGKEVR